MLTKSTILRRDIPLDKVVSYFKELGIDMDDPEFFEIEPILQKIEVARKGFYAFEPYYYGYAFKERIEGFERRTRFINILRELSRSQSYLLVSQSFCIHDRTKYYAFIKGDENKNPIASIPNTMPEPVTLDFS
jgi:hypothetical protein